MNESKEAVKILREIALVKGSNVGDHLKLKMLAQLERKLEELYGVESVKTDDKADANRAVKRV